jgi:hypothetical protein
VSSRRARFALAGTGLLLVSAVVALICTDQLDYDSHVTLGELIVGVGTLALAGFTAWLAYRTSQEVDWTRRSVEASEASVDLTRESIEAQDRPFVVATPHEQAPRGIRLLDAEALQPTFATFSGEGAVIASSPARPARWELWFRFWNIGKGPAIVDGFWLRDDDGDLLEALDTERPIGTDEARDEMWLVDPARYEAVAPGLECELRITYRDSSGKRYETTSNVEVDGEYRCRCEDYRRGEA